jgi:hypothetical protein
VKIAGRRIAMENIKTVTDQELLVTLKKMRGGECQIVADIVRYLAEVDERQVYRDYGYSSLFMFCVKGLGYSEGSAQRRIAAARCLRENSEVYELLKDGKVSLCSLSEVAKVITPEDRAQVLSLSQGLPRQEVQKLAAQFQAPERSKREVMRAKRVVVPVAPDGESSSTVAVIDKYALSLEIDGECREMIEQAKDLCGESKVSELMKVVLKEYIARRQPKAVKPKQDKPAAKPETKARAVSSRYIVKQVRDQVRVRDGQQCSFTSLDGTRCCEKRGLEFDHIVPFARGGGREADNLRLVCRAHNQLYAEQHFGREFMCSKRLRQE